MKKFLLVLGAIASFVILHAILVSEAAGPFPPALGGLGTGVIPASGTIPIGNGTGTYTPAFLTPGSNVTIVNASGSITISASGGGGGSTTTINGITTSTFVFAASGSGLTVASSGFTVTFTYSSSSLNLGAFYLATNPSGYISSAPSTTTINGTQSSTFYIIGDGTTITSTVSGATTTFKLINTGNWAGTWQGVNSTTFYLASNPSGYISVAPATTTIQVSTTTLTGPAFVFATTTKAGTFDITASGTNAFKWIAPPAGDQYFAPSTTVPTNTNQLTNGNNFLGVNSTTLYVVSVNGNAGTVTITSSSLAVATNTLSFVNGAGFLANASITTNAPITWSVGSVIGFNTSTAMSLSGLYTFLGGLTANSTATFNSSTILGATPNALLLTNSSGLIAAYTSSTTSGGSNCLTSITFSATGTLSNTNGACSGGGGSGGLSSSTPWTANFIPLILNGNSLTQSMIQQLQKGLVIATGTGTWPVDSATASLLQLGSSTIQGGNASGTFLGINAKSGFNGDFINFQIGSSSMFSVASSGNITLGSSSVSGAPLNENFITTPGSSLTVGQTGDQYGGTNMKLANRDGFNGVHFNNLGIDLFDFSFCGSSAACKGIRFEHRAGALLNSNNGGGELQFGTAGSSNLLIGPTVSEINTADVPSSGGFGINTYQPSSTLHVVTAGTSSSTVQIGTASRTACLEMGTASGTAKLVYITFDSNAVMTATTTKPSACQ